MNPNKHPQSVQNLHGATPQPFDRDATFTLPKPGKLLRLPAVEERTGLKKSSIYAGVKAGTFPAPVRLSARAVAFRDEDLDRWICERVKVVPINGVPFLVCVDRLGVCRTFDPATSQLVDQSQPGRPDVLAVPGR